MNRKPQKKVDQPVTTGSPATKAAQPKQPQPLDSKALAQVAGGTRGPATFW